MTVENIAGFLYIIQNSHQTAIKIEKFVPPVIFAPDTFPARMSAKCQEYASVEVKI